MNCYILNLSDGTQGHMRIIDEETTVEKELEKMNYKILTKTDPNTGEQTFADIISYELMK